MKSRIRLGYFFLLSFAPNVERRMTSMQKSVYINIECALRVCVTKQHANNKNNNRLSFILIYKINREKISVMNAKILILNERKSVWLDSTRFGPIGSIWYLVFSNSIKKNQTSTVKLVCMSAIWIKQKYFKCNEIIRWACYSFAHYLTSILAR